MSQSAFAISNSVRKFGVAVFPVMLAFAVTSCVTQGKRVSSVDVIYIPLRVSTYSAVTMDNINEYDGCRFSLPARVSKKIGRWRLNGNRAFDANNVRVAIFGYKGQIFIDQNRVVHRRDASGAVTELSELDALIESLEALRRSGGCRQFDWMTLAGPGSAREASSFLR